MSRPDLANVPEWYHRYIIQVPENDLRSAFENQSADMINYLQQIPADKRDYRYAEGKWSIKELLQHLVDAERVFAYRALRFARKDSTPLSGFDENTYAANAKTDQRNWDDLVEEFKSLRRSTEIMFRAFDEDQLESIGVSSGNSINVRALGFIIVGHVKHHVNILNERYFSS